MMHHANRILIDHAHRRAEERISRAELLRQVRSVPARLHLQALLARLPRLFGPRALGVPSDLETTSG